MNDYGIRQEIKLNMDNESPTKSTKIFDNNERESSESSDSDVLSSKRDSPSK